MGIVLDLETGFSFDFGDNEVLVDISSLIKIEIILVQGTVVSRCHDRSVENSKS